MKTADQYEILVIEDDPTQRAALDQLLTNAGYNVKLTDSAEKALHFVDEGIDCVIAGVISGDISRIDLITQWRNFFPETPLPLIHQTQSAASLVEAVSANAHHSLHGLGDAKLMLSRLMGLVKACQQKATTSVVKELDGTKDGLIGRSPPMLDVFDLIRPLEPSLQHGVDSGRIRNRQRPCRAGHSPKFSPWRRTIHRHELRCHARVTGGKRIIWL